MHWKLRASRSSLASGGHFEPPTTENTWSRDHSQRQLVGLAGAMALAITQQEQDAQGKQTQQQQTEVGEAHPEVRRREAQNEQAVPSASRAKPVGLGEVSWMEWPMALIYG